jgi:hypothetical protein
MKCGKRQDVPADATSDSDHAEKVFSLEGNRTQNNVEYDPKNTKANAHSDQDEYEMSPLMRRILLAASIVLSVLGLVGTIAFSISASRLQTQYELERSYSVENPFYRRSWSTYEAMSDKKDLRNVSIGLMVVSLAGTAFFSYRILDERRRTRLAELRKDIAKRVENHADTLLEKRSDLLEKDEYGFVDDTAWMKEVRYFLEKVAGISMRRKRIVNVGIEVTEETLDRLSRSHSDE